MTKPRGEPTATPHAYVSAFGRPLTTRPPDAVRHSREDDKALNHSTSGCNSNSDVHRWSLQEQDNSRNNNRGNSRVQQPTGGGRIDFGCSSARTIHPQGVYITPHVRWADGTLTNLEGDNTHSVSPFSRSYLSRPSKKSGNIFRVGLFLDHDFVRLTTRAEGPHGAHVRRAKRKRIDRRSRVILPLFYGPNMVSGSVSSSLLSYLS